MKRQDNPEANMSRLSTKSIARVIENVKDENIVKYLPDGLINDEQKDIKYNALAEVVKYTNDKNDRTKNQPLPLFHSGRGFAV